MVSVQSPRGCTSRPAGDAGRPEIARLQWFEAPAAADPVLRAGLAHLWFVTVHPFEDGNGRIARAVADMALARSEGSSQRFYSMSSQIRAERAAYYDVLERTQRGTTDVTDWMTWFLACLGRSIEAAGTALAAVLAKARFWERASGLALNERQRRVLNRVLDGFEGKLTTSKWAKLAKCSRTPRCGHHHPGRHASWPQPVAAQTTIACDDRPPAGD